MTSATLDRPRVSFRYMAVTPAQALEWLEGRKRNRRVSKNRYVEMAADMIEGKWDAGTGEPIKFDDQGVLVDGVHRLRAVVHADTPVGFYVASGVSGIDNLDTGRSRSLADLWAIHDLSTQIARDSSAAKQAYLYYLRDAEGRPVPRPWNTPKVRRLFRNRDVVAFGEEHQALIADVCYPAHLVARRYRGVSGTSVQASMVVVRRWAASQEDSEITEAVHDFEHGLLTGEGIQPGDARTAWISWNTNTARDITPATKREVGLMLYLRSFWMHLNDETTTRFLVRDYSRYEFRLEEQI